MARRDLVVVGASAGGVEALLQLLRALPADSAVAVLPRLRVVMELLGHSPLRTTMDVYSRVRPALAREAADRMSTLLLSDGWS
jgi:integrase